MADLSTFSVASRWPAKHPDRLQLYSFPTANGVKISIALEEIGLPYEAHLVDLSKNESHTPEFLSLNPNGKIPAIVDPNGPGGKPLPLFESGAILVYLAEKTGKLMAADPALRYETLEWVFFQMASIGPMFGQLGFFHKFAGKDIADKRALERYRDETKRLLGVLDRRLDGRQWIMGDDYTIADVSMIGWVRTLNGFYEAGEILGYDKFRNVIAWLDRALARPAVQRGLDIPTRPCLWRSRSSAPPSVRPDISPARGEIGCHRGLDSLAKVAPEENRWFSTANGWRNQCGRPISPLAGEMSGRTEGGAKGDNCR